MIPPDALLYIYEIRGVFRHDLPAAPPSYVGLWNEEEFAYLFFTHPQDQYVEDLISGSPHTTVSRHEMKYRDWQTGLPSQGISIGNLTFVPRDHPSPPDDAILLDPSVVFGDGSHPTTVSCIRSLLSIVSSTQIDSLLDLGTGTGILALAGASLGIDRILAVDRNRLSVATALENVRSNAMSSVITVKEGEARLFLDSPFDIIMANLPFLVLRDIVPTREATKHRIWIVSGINREQGEMLKDLFGDQSFECTNWLYDRPWVTFTAVNQAMVEAATPGQDQIR